MQATEIATRTTTVKVRPLSVACPACQNLMDLGFTTTTARCLNDSCDLYNEPFALELPSFEVTLRSI
jgi:Fe2+ transport system protein FeoA